MTDKCCYSIAALLALLALVATASLHVLAWLDKGIEIELFDITMTQHWDRYDLEIVETSWLMYIWIAVYTYQALWLLYGLSAPCRKTKTGWLGAHPPVIPPSIYFSFILSLGCLVGWIFLWNMYHHYANYSILCMAGSAIFTSISLCISVYATKIHGHELVAEGHGGSVWSIRIFVQNGLAAMATWTMIYIFYIMDLLLTRTNLASRQTSGFAALGVMLGYLLVWLFLDILVSRDTMAFVITPYLMVITAFIMAIWKNQDGGLHFMLSIIFVAISGVLLLIKISLTLGRNCGKNGRPSPPESFGAVSYEENHGSNESMDADDLGDLRDLSDQMYLHPDDEESQ